MLIRTLIAAAFAAMVWTAGSAMAQDAVPPPPPAPDTEPPQGPQPPANIFVADLNLL